MTGKIWSFGEKIIHKTKPDWGVGVITQVQPARQDGVPCQRLTVRFNHGGLKTLSTALADLTTPEELAAATLAGTASATTPEETQSRLTTLPESVTDPFLSLASRFKAAMDLFKFSDTGAGLLAWATSQTGLADPLAMLSRHELEDLFQRFRLLLTRHARTLSQELTRTNAAEHARILVDAPVSARNALRSGHTRR